MAQTGYTPIQLYSSSTGGNTPSASNLTNNTIGSELAINITDGKLFYKDNANAVQVIAWKTTPTTAGGTGLTSYTAGDLLYYVSGTTLSKLGIGTNGQILKSTGSAPAWENVSALAVTSLSFGTTGLTPSTTTQGAITVAGTLATTNGGTGLTSFTANGVMYASSTSALATSNNFTWSSTDFVSKAATTTFGAGTSASKIQINVSGSTAAGTLEILGGGSGNPSWDIGTSTATTKYTIGYTASSTRTVVSELDNNGNLVNLGAIGPSASLTNASSVPIASKVIGAMKPLKVTLNNQVAGTGGTYSGGLLIVSNVTDSTHAIYAYSGFATSAGYTILASTGANWSTSYNAAGKEGIALDSGGNGPYLFSNLGGSKTYQVFCFGGS